MLELSFGWTSPALLAGVKTRTRRDWKPIHAAKFRTGREVRAIDKDRRAGGKPIAILRLTRDAYLSAEYPEADWYCEGLAWLQQHGYKLPGTGRPGLAPIGLWRDWQRTRPSLYVVSFEVEEVLV